MPRGTNPGEFNEKHWEKELKVVSNIITIVALLTKDNPFWFQEFVGTSKPSLPLPSSRTSLKAYLLLLASSNMTKVYFNS